MGAAADGRDGAAHSERGDDRLDAGLAGEPPCLPAVGEAAESGNPARADGGELKGSY